MKFIATGLLMVATDYQIDVEYERAILQVNSARVSNLSIKNGSCYG